MLLIYNYVPEENNESGWKCLKVIVAMYHRFVVESYFAENLRLTFTKSDTISPTIWQQTHTHPFNGPISGTTRVSRYQKGKTNLDLNEATDSEWQWHQLGHMQVCTSLQTNNHASTPPLSFLQADSKHSTKIWSRKSQTQIGLFRIMQDNFAKKIPTMSCYSGRVLDKKSTKIRIRSKCR